MSNASAQNMICNFEEVYQNGQIQQGFFLLKDKRLRYEYTNYDLYKIFFVNEKIFVIENKNPSKFQELSTEGSIIPIIFDIYKDFPNFKKKYLKNGYKILVEKNNNEFIKRLSIQSSKVNVSIYFIDCVSEEINEKYFRIKPVSDYVRN